MAQKPQTLKNHVRFDPPFHFFLAPVGMLLVIWAIVDLAREPGWMSAAHVVLAVWLVVWLTRTRLYALKVQDRLIRLEERLRLQELLPAAERSRIGDLTEDQLIGLRFASDGEAADLARKALEGNWNRKQIKEAVKNWRPDYFRV